MSRPTLRDETKPREGGLFPKGSLTIPMSDAFLTSFDRRAAWQ